LQLFALISVTINKIVNVLNVTTNEESLMVYHLEQKSHPTYFFFVKSHSVFIIFAMHIPYWYCDKFDYQNCPPLLMDVLILPCEIHKFDCLFISTVK